MKGEPVRLWRVTLPGNLPLMFTNEDAMRNRIEQLRRGGHTEITVRTADVGEWRDA